MNESISFFVKGIPKAWQRPRFNRKTGAIFTAKGDAVWRDSVWGQAMPHAPESPFTGPVELTLTFYLPIPTSWPGWKREAAILTDIAKRPDLDNLVKAIKDGLTGSFWLDDAQVSSLCAGKRYTPRDGQVGVYVSITPLRSMPRTKREWLGIDAQDNPG